MTAEKITLKRAHASALDLSMAALAALSVGFVAFAMPDGLFADAVTASGLPAILPAAQPPLGMTARLGVVLPAALVAFLATWMLLRALGTVGGGSRRRQAAEVEAMPLRLRRADAHPDAPLRHPLIAGLDLGEPASAEEAEGETWDSFPSAMEPEEAGTWGEASEEAPVQDDIAAVSFEPPLELEEPTIAQLMQRLEVGLVRRQQKEPLPSLGAEDASVAETPQPADERLRSVLDDLRTMATRRA